MPEPILTVSDLKVHYKTKTGFVYAVNGVSFDLMPGEILTIVGESGSGKTVSMLAIMRLIDPPGEVTSGQVLLAGKDMYQRTQDELQQVRGSKIAMISQDPDTALNPILQIGLQVSEAITVHQEMSKKEARERTIDLLATVGIPEPGRYLDSYPHQLSGGMRQRVMIAVALACQPEILIADEPTTALDVTVQAEIIELMLRLQKQFGMSVLWITHDLGVVARVAQRVLVMYAGMIVEEARVTDLFTSPRHPYSIGLLSARPRVTDEPGARLYNIPGAPPVMAEEPKGCPFVPRCRYATGRCRLENPPLMEADVEHLSACWEHRRFAPEAAEN